MKVVEKAFELVILFLEEQKDNNPQSTVEWHIDDRKWIQHLLLCPEYTDQVLALTHAV